MAVGLGQAGGTALAGLAAEHRVGGDLLPLLAAVAAWLLLVGARHRLGAADPSLRRGRHRRG
ncbi:hypothetical protein [Streptomyces sp. NPDC097619]|uniref:hypothetical protein n=1 Tax=Streptomyces sp. NPDC097619 TaxID=3157228 RepID=UPI00332DAE16